MSDPTSICQLAFKVLSKHQNHPQYAKMTIPGIQGVEAMLNLLHDCYGFSHPGGLFLAAVDVMLEKEAVVNTVVNLLQGCAHGSAAPASQHPAAIQPLVHATVTPDTAAISTKAELEAASATPDGSIQQYQSASGSPGLDVNTAAGSEDSTVSSSAAYASVTSNAFSIASDVTGQQQTAGQQQVQLQEQPHQHHLNEQPQQQQHHSWLSLQPTSQSRSRRSSSSGGVEMSIGGWASEPSITHAAAAAAAAQLTLTQPHTQFGNVLQATATAAANSASSDSGTALVADHSDASCHTGKGLPGAMHDIQLTPPLAAPKPPASTPVGTAAAATPDVTAVVSTPPPPTYQQQCTRTEGLCEQGAYDQPLTGAKSHPATAEDEDVPMAEQYSSPKHADRSTTAAAATEESLLPVQLTAQEEVLRQQQQLLHHLLFSPSDLTASYAGSLIDVNRRQQYNCARDSVQQQLFREPAAQQTWRQQQQHQSAQGLEAGLAQQVALQLQQQMALQQQQQQVIMAPTMSYYQQQVEDVSGLVAPVLHDAAACSDALSDWLSDNADIADSGSCGESGSVHNAYVSSPAAASTAVLQGVQWGAAAGVGPDSAAPELVEQQQRRRQQQQHHHHQQQQWLPSGQSGTLSSVAADTQPMLSAAESAVLSCTLTPAAAAAAPRSQQQQQPPVVHEVDGLLSSQGSLCTASEAGSVATSTQADEAAYAFRRQHRQQQQQHWQEWQTHTQHGQQAAGDFAQQHPVTPQAARHIGGAAAAGEGVHSVAGSSSSPVAPSPIPAHTPLALTAAAADDWASQNPLPEQQQQQQLNMSVAAGSEDPLAYPEVRYSQSNPPVISGLTQGNTSSSSSSSSKHQLSGSDVLLPTAPPASALYQQSLELFGGNMQQSWDLIHSNMQDLMASMQLQPGLHTAPLQYEPAQSANPTAAFADSTNDNNESIDPLMNPVDPSSLNPTSSRASSSSSVLDPRLRHCSSIALLAGRSLVGSTEGSQWQLGLNWLVAADGSGALGHTSVSQLLLEMEQQQPQEIRVWGREQAHEDEENTADDDGDADAAAVGAAVMVETEDVQQGTENTVFAVAADDLDEAQQQQQQEKWLQGQVTELEVAAVAAAAAAAAAAPAAGEVTSGQMPGNSPAASDILYAAAAASVSDGDVAVQRHGHLEQHDELWVLQQEEVKLRQEMNELEQQLQAKQQQQQQHRYVQAEADSVVLWSDAYTGRPLAADAAVTAAGWQQEQQQSVRLDVAEQAAATAAAVENSHGSIAAEEGAAVAAVGNEDHGVYASDRQGEAGIQGDLSYVAAAEADDYCAAASPTPVHWHASEQQQQQCDDELSLQCQEEEYSGSDAQQLTPAAVADNPQQKAVAAAARAADEAARAAAVAIEEAAAAAAAAMAYSWSPGWKGVSSRAAQLAHDLNAAGSSSRTSTVTNPLFVDDEDDAVSNPLYEDDADYAEEHHITGKFVSGPSEVQQGDRTLGECEYVQEWQHKGGFAAAAAAAHGSSSDHSQSVAAVSPAADDFDAAMTGWSQQQPDSTADACNAGHTSYNLLQGPDHEGLVADSESSTVNNHFLNTRGASSGGVVACQGHAAAAAAAAQSNDAVVSFSVNHEPDKQQQQIVEIHNSSSLQHILFGESSKESETTHQSSSVDLPGGSPARAAGSAASVAVDAAAAASVFDRQRGIQQVRCSDASDEQEPNVQQSSSAALAIGDQDGAAAFFDPDMDTTSSKQHNICEQQPAVDMLELVQQPLASSPFLSRSIQQLQQLQQQREAWQASKQAVSEHQQLQQQQRSLQKQMQAQQEQLKQVQELLQQQQQQEGSVHETPQTHQQQQEFEQAAEQQDKHEVTAHSLPRATEDRMVQPVDICKLQQGEQECECQDGTIPATTETAAVEGNSKPACGLLNSPVKRLLQQLRARRAAGKPAGIAADAEDTSPAVSLASADDVDNGHSSHLSIAAVAAGPDSQQHTMPGDAACVVHCLSSAVEGDCDETVLPTQTLNSVADSAATAVRNVGPQAVESGDQAAAAATAEDYCPCDVVALPAAATASGSNADDGTGGSVLQQLQQQQEQQATHQVVIAGQVASCGASVQSAAESASTTAAHGSNILQQLLSDEDQRLGSAHVANDAASTWNVSSPKHAVAAAATVVSEHPACAAGAAGDSAAHYSKVQDPVGARKPADDGDDDVHNEALVDAASGTAEADAAFATTSPYSSKPMRADSAVDDIPAAAVAVAQQHPEGLCSNHINPAQATSAVVAAAAAAISTAIHSDQAYEASSTNVHVKQQQQRSARPLPAAPVLWRQKIKGLLAAADEALAIINKSSKEEQAVIKSATAAGSAGAASGCVSAAAAAAANSSGVVRAAAAIMRDRSRLIISRLDDEPEDADDEPEDAEHTGFASANQQQQQQQLGYKHIVDSSQHPDVICRREKQQQQQQQKTLLRSRALPPLLTSTAPPSAQSAGQTTACAVAATSRAQQCRNMLMTSSSSSSPAAAAAAVVVGNGGVGHQLQGLVDRCNQQEYQHNLASDADDIHQQAPAKHQEQQQQQQHVLKPLQAGRRSIDPAAASAAQIKADLGEVETSGSSEAAGNSIAAAAAVKERGATTVNGLLVSTTLQHKSSVRHHHQQQQQQQCYRVSPFPQGSASPRDMVAAVPDTTEYKPAVQEKLQVRQVQPHVMSKQQQQQQCKAQSGVMFDRPRPQGYLYNKVKAAALADMKKVAAAAANNADKLKRSKAKGVSSDNVKAAAATAAGLHHVVRVTRVTTAAAAAAGSRVVNNRHDSSSLTPDNSELSVLANAGDLQHTPMKAAPSAAVANTNSSSCPEPQQRHNRVASLHVKPVGRSHGLSLRKGTNSNLQQHYSTHSAAAAATAAKSGSKHPAAADKITAAAAACGGGGGGVRPPAGLNLNPLGPSIAGTRSDHSHEPVSKAAAAAAAGVMGISSQGAGSSSSTPVGVVAAVAAVRAAAAGFGDRGWQRQDILNWLSRLRLDLLPDESSQPLTDNPVRNGLLLAGIAAAVTGQPTNNIYQPVRTIAAARSNLLRAAAHIGMVNAEFAVAAAAAAAAEDREEALADDAAAGDSRGRLRSRSRSRSTSRSRSRGRRGSKEYAAGQCTAASSSGGSSALSPRMQRQRRLQLNPCQQQQQQQWSCNGGSSPGGSVSASPACHLDCECFAAAAAASVVSSSSSSRSGRRVYASILDPCCCSCCCCSILPDATVLDHAVFVLLESVLAGDSAAAWGLLYALQQTLPTAKTTAAAAVDQSAAVQRLQQRRKMQQQERLQQQVSDATVVGSSSSGCCDGLITVHPLVGASWRFKLPYTAEQLDRLEEQLLQWLLSLDLICDADVAAGFPSLTGSITSGVLLCEVAAAVAAAAVAGVNERPRTAAARRANIQLAVEVVRHLPGLKLGRLLQSHESAVVSGDRLALTALLEALYNWHTQQQQKHT